MYLWRVIFLVLFMVFFFLLLFVREGEAGMTIKALARKSEFIEDQKTIFSCHVPDAVDGDEVVWLLQDPETGSKVFYSYSMLDESPPMKLDGKKEATFSLLMRRDFNGKQLLCRSTRTNQEANMTLREIKITIPIKKVVFKVRNFVYGKPLNFSCEVESKPEFVKLVDFRGSMGMVKANTKELIDKSKYRYISNNPNVRASLDHNDLLMHCFAARDGFKQPTGNVLSQSEQLIIHYFKVEDQSFIRKSVIKGNAIAIDFRILCNPKPSNYIFSVTTNTSEVIKEKVSITKATGKYEYKVHLEFTPSFAAEYYINYNAEILKQPKAMTAAVTFEEPDSSNGIKTSGKENTHKTYGQKGDSKFSHQSILIFGIIGGAAALMIATVASLMIYLKYRGGQRPYGNKDSSPERDPLAVIEEKADPVSTEC